MKSWLGCGTLLTLLLVGTSIISVSPNSSATTRKPTTHTTTPYQATNLLMLPLTAENGKDENSSSKSVAIAKSATLKLFDDKEFNTNKGLNNNNNNNNNINRKNYSDHYFSYSNNISSTSSSSNHNHKINNHFEIFNVNLTNLETTTVVAAAATTDDEIMRIMTTRAKKSLEKQELNFYHKDNNFWSKKFKHKRDVELNDAEEGGDICAQFNIGDESRRTFYSPDYPNNYPKSIDCNRTIEAQEGQLIRLDFLNYFEIEDKDSCKFDYLEVRDGKYGFSNLIGTYCGQNFPPMITSTERHLWLHFHSDESIEYRGFEAVYEYISRPENAPSTDLDCVIEKKGFEGWVNHTDVPEYILTNATAHKIAVDCLWVITVQPDWKIQTRFPEFELAKPNDCVKNFIDLFEAETTIPGRVKNFCGSAGEAYQSKSNLIYVRFYAEPIALNKSRFSMLYTAIRDKGGGCTEDEYDCEDGTCIALDLKCNKRGNCKFQWDEEHCDSESGPQSDQMIIIIVVFALILGGMIVSFLFKCTRKLIRDQKLIREHIRQSKESKLDEMGKRSGENLSVKLSPREKHSQTSLQILDDVSNRFYRDIIPGPMKIGNTDIKAGGDTILRQQHDMIVQTSLSSDSTLDQSGNGGTDGNAMCDMGCQTRESLFQTSSGSLVRQKSIISSASPHQSQTAIRFSTFGYDAAAALSNMNPPLVATNKGNTLGRQNTLNKRASTAIELEELHHHQHHSHLQQAMPQPQSLHRIGSNVGHKTEIMRQPEICHHHHQHQQHLQQIQQKQQLKQQHQYNQQHPSHHYVPATVNSNTMGGNGGGGVNGKNGKQKVDESKVFIDIRNSAPDVIIMTSH